MNEKVALHKVYKKSPDMVVRTIAGKVIIVPLNKGVEDADSSFFSLNKTGIAIWEKINGKESFQDITQVLAKRFSASAATLEKDVMGFAAELYKRGMIVES